MDEEYTNETTSETKSENGSIESIETINNNNIELNNPELSFDYLTDIEEDIFETMEEYMKNEIITISSPNFYKKFIEDISIFYYEYWLDCGICDEDDYDEIEEIVQQLSEIYFDICEIPLRSMFNTSNILINVINQEDIELITQKLAELKAIPQAKQKTAEWNNVRNNLLTASNIWKVFSSQAQQNSLIFEKCKPLDENKIEYMNANTNSTMHWGVKYEPVTVMLYENMYQTKLDDFGCIPHPKYNFIGASPDGINSDPANRTLYGRMVEIKNIYNREITGKPKEEYWVQTQIQMETCDLDECDFVETRIKEYENEEQFYQDTEHEYKGVVIYFIKRTTSYNNSFTSNVNAPFYKYMPLELEKDKTSIEKWIKETKELHKEEYVLFNTLYWYLDEISCVLIKRNKLWFATALPKIQELWNIILKERVDGYEHRASKKRIKTEVVVETDINNSDKHIIKNLPLSNHICLVKLSGNESTNANNTKFQSLL
jgi:putative phage-type endonuclease